MHHYCRSSYYCRDCIDRCIVDKEEVLDEVSDQPNHAELRRQVQELKAERRRLKYEDENHFPKADPMPTVYPETKQ